MRDRIGVLRHKLKFGLLWVNLCLRKMIMHTSCQAVACCITCKDNDTQAQHFDIATHCTGPQSATFIQFQFSDFLSFSLPNDGGSGRGRGRGRGLKCGGPEKNFIVEHFPQASPLLNRDWAKLKPPDYFLSPSMLEGFEE